MSCPTLRSQIPIYLSLPAEMHCQLLLNATSQTPSCPVNVTIGFIIFDDKTEPNYRLVGPDSRSNIYRTLEEAEMILGKEGENFKAQFDLSDLVVLKTQSGVFAKLLAVVGLYFSEVHKQTELFQDLDARSFLLAGDDLITLASPGWVIICLIFRLGCFLAESQLNMDFKSLMKQWSQFGIYTVAITMQFGVFCHEFQILLQTPSVRHEKYTLC